MRSLTIAAAMLVLFAETAARAAAPPALEPLGFLLGVWLPAGTDQAEGASGRAEFTRGLQDRVILRTSYAEYPAAAGKPRSRHDDLMIIYAAAGGVIRADYYDNEGHVIRYVVRCPAPAQAVFLSEPTGNEPRYRLSYALQGTGVLKGDFAIAPPGAPEAFKPYLAWESRKAAGPAK
jgi:hypothetical protein